MKGIDGDFQAKITSTLSALRYLLAFLHGRYGKLSQRSRIRS